MTLPCFDTGSPDGPGRMSYGPRTGQFGICGIFVTLNLTYGKERGASSAISFDLGPDSV
jgi:hypothetical protein